MDQELTPKIDGIVQPMSFLDGVEPHPDYTKAIEAQYKTAEDARIQAKLDEIQAEQTKDIPGAVLWTHETIEEYRREWATPDRAIELAKVQHLREIRNALRDIDNTLRNELTAIGATLGEILNR